MSRYKPFEFQNKAVGELTDRFLGLWDHPSRGLNLVFKSPTGSGKTFMVCNFIHGLNSLAQWDADKAFIWITFSDTLAMQSRDKFERYFLHDLQNRLLTVEDFDQGKLTKNDILFVNWQKLVSRSAEGRILRRPADPVMYKEQGYYFEDVIENTRKDGREIIMIVDESHTHLSELARKTVVETVDPKIIVHVSATPRFEPSRQQEEEGSAGFVYVKRSDVIAEGLIKESIRVQTDEDLKKFPGKDLDILLIDLAIEKKKELELEYERLGKRINPLVLIQLPNDDRKLRDIGERTKESVVLDHLHRQGVDIDRRVAIWLDGRYENMEFISDNDSQVDFMLFKQAAATGWDCPRAHILVMFREITSPIFHTQTIGRILRMADPYNRQDYSSSTALRTGFLFTNYKRNEVSIPEQGPGNKPMVYEAGKREGITGLGNICSDYVSRVDYGDLGSAVLFQKSFLRSMNEFFGIGEGDLLQESRRKIVAKGVDPAPLLTIGLVTDAQFTDYDKIALEFAGKGHQRDYEISRNDVEKLFNFWCYRLLAEQTEQDTKVSNVSRSWSPLKSALRVWSRTFLDTDSDSFYRIFVADVNRGPASVFRQAVTRALKNYYPIKKDFLDSRKKELEAGEASRFEIKEVYGYTDDYSVPGPEETTSRLSAVQPFYIRKEYNGRKNEIHFIKYLEQKEDVIEWWFKNGDSGKEFFGLRYFNRVSGHQALFYPDWIVKFTNGRVGIFDTKSGLTAADPQGREEGLARKIEELNRTENIYFGGIVLMENNQWYLSATLPYRYTSGQLTENWVLLDTMFRT